MIKKEYIQLRHYHAEDGVTLAAFELTEEQEAFTAMPVNYREAAEGQRRIVIAADGEPVGFFLLHATERVKDYTDNPDAMLLTSFSVNLSKQGKGYAKRGLLMLRDFVQKEFPECSEIILAVNQRNTAAQQLYFKTGFQDTGKRKMGPIGEQMLMRMDI